MSKRFADETRLVRFHGTYTLICDHMCVNIELEFHSLLHILHYEITRVQSYRFSMVIMCLTFYYIDFNWTENVFRNILSNDMRVIML